MEAGLAGSRLSAGFLLAAILLIRIPFLNQAIQGDDDIYITEAAHAQVDPLHPANTHYIFRGDEVDLRGHSHPPLNAWPLALLVAVFGEVKEVPFHVAYIAFSLIAVWSMWSMAIPSSQTSRSSPSGWRRSLYSSPAERAGQLSRWPSARSKPIRPSS